MSCAHTEQERLVRTYQIWCEKGCHDARDVTNLHPSDIIDADGISIILVGLRISIQLSLKDPGPQLTWFEGSRWQVTVSPTVA